MSNISPFTKKPSQVEMITVSDKVALVDAHHALYELSIRWIERSTRFSERTPWPSADRHRTLIRLNQIRFETRLYGLGTMEERAGTHRASQMIRTTTGYQDRMPGYPPHQATIKQVVASAPAEMAMTPNNHELCGPPPVVSLNHYAYLR